jgi:hypothetical protein
VIPLTHFDQYFATHRYNSFKIPSIQKKRNNEESESMTGKRIRTAGRRRNRRTRRRNRRKN